MFSPTVQTIITVNFYCVKVPINIPFAKTQMEGRRGIVETSLNQAKMVQGDVIINIDGCFYLRMRDSEYKADSEYNSKQPQWLLLDAPSNMIENNPFIFEKYELPI